MNEKESFIAGLYPAAVEVSNETGMAWQTILAQAAQETGWGQHQLPGSHNIFNIKADPSWHGPSKTFNVWEIENGQKVWKDQSFRVYGSDEEALRDRVEFLRDNPRYAKAGLFDEGTKGSLEKESAALQQAGYATDPHYAEGLVRVFNSPTMQNAIKAAQTLEATGYHSPDSQLHQQAILEQGTHGTAVTALQADLAKLGYGQDRGQPLEADGDFGIQTRHAVERFQHDHHLAVDGKAGPLTQQAMRSALQSHTRQDALHHLGDPRNPDHALYEQALAGVSKLDAQHGRTVDGQSHNIAAALVVEAKREGMTRIDQVALGDGNSRVFIVQKAGSLMETDKYGAVDTVKATQTAMAQSSDLAAAIQPPVTTPTPGVQPTAPSQAMVI
ncbi:XVIPCD domain-containing protein [Rhodanobacter sp. DHB23]|uniref:XVIPCD domain-containing protein n=1 Tax=Rhodanobacter sp. DHB23 TaxID=2775923 RepID=UPI00177FA597|nr:XVIPCD domain-containing protein [Rhodanobacter sp. DHB23]MBD8871873.1 peptidoglycan-binding protein [Rhodanobacter sp. DHB23]